jgi:protein-L-isoaspartate(D-aspartate) O-methyltransferase
MVRIARQHSWTFIGAGFATLLVACSGCDRLVATRSTVYPSADVGGDGASSEKEGGKVHSESAREQAFARARKAMVDRQLAGRDITDQRVLKAMAEVPRHRFVPASLWPQAYEDYPLPIGLDQTISQPYVVAFMTQALKLEGNERVLEIGTGSGYQAAVLARLCKEVYSIEIIPDLSKRAGAAFKKLGITNVHLRVGDGYKGWPKKAPFDAIMVTAAPPTVPQPLIKQLAQEGRMILPVGELDQDLVLIERTAQGLKRHKVLPVRFVPMTGEAQQRR